MLYRLGHGLKFFLCLKVFMINALKILESTCLCFSSTCNCKLLTNIAYFRNFAFRLLEISIVDSIFIMFVTLDSKAERYGGRAPSATLEADHFSSCNLRRLPELG